MLIDFAQNSLTGAQPGITTLTDLTTDTGDTLVAMVIYDVGNDAPVLSTDFGTWVELTEFQRLDQSPRFHVFLIQSALAGTADVSATFGANREFPGIIVFQLRDVGDFIDGVVPAYNNPGSGDDVVTTGPYTVTDSPNYVLAFACDLSGSGTPPPNGTTSVFTSEGTAWQFGAGTDNARIVDYTAPTDGAIEATWNSGFGSHTYLAILLAFGLGEPPPAGNVSGRALLLGVGG